MLISKYWSKNKLSSFKKYSNFRKILLAYGAEEIGKVQLNEISKDDGATLFMSGSHKAAFSRPDELSLRDSLLWESYTCSPGSAVIFTEGLCHTGQRWSNKHRDRLSLFTCYDTVNSKWGKGCPPEALPPQEPRPRPSMPTMLWLASRTR